MGIASSEVQHPCGVGTHFVEAGIQCVLQFNGTMSLSVFYNQLLRLYREPDRVEQLNVENAAEICLVEVVFTYDIGFIPDTFSFIIRGIIEMNVNTLRGELVGKALEVLLPSVEQRVDVLRRIRIGLYWHEAYQYHCDGKD